MGIATVLMGLLPTYQAIGMAAPIILIILRLVQGLGIGGEWGGAVLLAVEYSPKEKRGFYGAFPQMGVTIGMFLGSGALSFITSIVSPESFVAWGWRIPFILSALLVIFGLWIRKGLDETPSFKKVQESGEIPKLPFVEIFKTQWKEVIIAVGGKVVETAPFYIFSTFIVSYGTNNLGFKSSQVLISIMIATIVTTILMPFMGSLSDKIGRKKVYITGIIGMILYAFPYFWLLEQRTFRDTSYCNSFGIRDYLGSDYGSAGDNVFRNIRCKSSIYRGFIGISNRRGCCGRNSSVDCNMAVGSI